MSKEELKTELAEVFRTKYTSLTFYHGDVEEVNILPKSYVYDKIVKSLRVEVNYITFKGYKIELVEEIRNPTPENVELFKKYMYACKEIDKNFFVKQYRVFNDKEDKYLSKKELESFINSLI
jgi:6-phosphogluconolactonase (cycloisomerase 2 family)